MPEVLFSSKTCLKARLSTKTQYRGLAEQYRGWAKTQYRIWAETQNRGSAAQNGSLRLSVRVLPFIGEALPHRAIISRGI